MIAFSFLFQSYSIYLVGTRACQARMKLGVLRRTGMSFFRNKNALELAQEYHWGLLKYIPGVY